MRIAIVLLVALTTLCLPVKADEFHLGKDRVITGVLVGEVDGRYKIRVEGGEIELPKKDVIKHVKTELKVADVQKVEDSKRAALAKANDERRARQAAWRAEQAQRRAAAIARWNAQRAARRAMFFPMWGSYRTYNPVIGNSSVTVREYSPGQHARVRTFSIQR